jgi:hypothetical protein
MASNIYGNGSMKLPVSRAEPKIRALIDRERERIRCALMRRKDCDICKEG